MAEVEAAEPRRLGQPNRQPPDGNGRGVRGERRLGRQRAFQVGQQLVLGGKRLDNRLDHQVAAGDRRQIVGSRDQPFDGRRRVARGRCADQRRSDLGPGRIHGLAVVVHNDYGQPATDLRSRDGRAHQPRADNAHAPHGPRHSRHVIQAGILPVPLDERGHVAQRPLLRRRGGRRFLGIGRQGLRPLQDGEGVTPIIQGRCRSNSVPRWRVRASTCPVVLFLQQRQHGRFHRLAGNDRQRRGMPHGGALGQQVLGLGQQVCVGPIARVLEGRLATGRRTSFQLVRGEFENSPYGARQSPRYSPCGRPGTAAGRGPGRRCGSRTRRGCDAQGVEAAEEAAGQHVRRPAGDGLVGEQLAEEREAAQVRRRPPRPVRR